jgi:hypothetical protein
MKASASPSSALTSVPSATIIQQFFKIRQHSVFFPWQFCSIQRPPIQTECPSHNCAPHFYPPSAALARSPACDSTPIASLVMVKGKLIIILCHGALCCDCLFGLIPSQPSQISSWPCQRTKSNAPDIKTSNLNSKNLPSKPILSN